MSFDLKFKKMHRTHTNYNDSPYICSKTVTGYGIKPLPIDGYI